MVVAIVAKTQSRRDADLGFGQQFLGELQRAQVRVGVGNLGPDVHGSLGLFHHPADLVQALDQQVTPLTILFGDIANALLVAFQCSDGRHL